MKLVKNPIPPRLLLFHRRHAASSPTAVDCDGGVDTRSNVKHVLTEKPCHNDSLRHLNYQLRSLLGSASPGSLSDALSILRGILSSDSTSPPDAATRSIVFSGLAKRSQPLNEESVALLVKMSKMGFFPPDAFLFTQLINKLCRGGATSGAWDFFHAVKDAGGSIEAPVCNALLTGLASIRDFARMNLLFSEMKGLGVRPSVVTFGILINHLCKSRRLDDALNVLDAMSSPDLGVPPDTIIFSILIDGLCKAGRLQDGLSLLDRMKSSHACDPNSVTYTSLIGAFLHSNNVGRATALFDEMLKEGVSPDSTTYFTLFYGLTDIGKLDDAYSMVSLMRKNGFRVDIKIYNTLISGFCKKKRLDKAFEIHDEMCKAGLRPDIFTYNTLIDTFCKVGDFSKADKFLSEMVDHGCKPNVVTYGTLINGYCKAGDLDQAMKIFRSMDVSVVPANTVIYNILIDSYCKNQKVDAAIDLFDEMQEQDILPNVITYTSIFQGLKDHNMSDKALELMDKMSSQGCKPNYVTMHVLTGWLTGIGETERLRLFLQRMTSSDIDGLGQS